MDLLDEIETKVARLAGHPRIEGVRAAARHISIAEKYLQRGRNESDPDAFNDVIYRTNQAFEGMLKEAYGVLTDSDGSKLSPHAIEQHLAKQKLLTDRVQALFANYRKEWRNPATHDHTLLFSEQEALLAIVNVSAFAVVLVDQIVETISFQRELADTRSKKALLVAELAPGVAAISLPDQIVELLRSFNRNRGTVRFESDAELIGSLSGFILGIEPTFEVTPEAKVGDTYRADLLVSNKHGESVVVEVKRARDVSRIERAGVAQVQEYMIAGGFSAGVLFLVGEEGQGTVTVKKIVSIEGRPVWVVRAPQAGPSVKSS